ncbi:HlyD family efflux transporter periplasmic adaptor subunit [Lachnobacterium bovis]|uniref:HlyD family efflux transporter periplasmic adaptor subunit n=1 Tax=Lachnobacterium bovis TaxID=140626 RepID=UPI0004885CF7|nr:HlyD family efflux transporter periplasmic adaptor subunit [Lachnobacterium bovis]
MGKRKIVRYKKPLNTNIGIIIFAIVLLYICMRVGSYFFSKTTATYEVQQGTIASNNVYRGLILRDEHIVKTEKTGYVNYYAKNNTKVSVEDNVYSIDTDGGLSNKIYDATDDTSVLSGTDIENISNDISGLTTSYNANNFQDVISFKTELSSELTQILSTNALGKLVSQVEQAASKKSFFLVKSEESGVVMYSTDGYENKTINEFSPTWFKNNLYKKKTLSAKSKVHKGDAVYKLITNDDWHVIIQTDSNTASKLKNNSEAKIKFCKDNKIAKAQCSIIKKVKDVYYVDLQLSDSMIRYASDRFIDLEIVHNLTDGLKIPATSLTSKKAYKIPKNYFVLKDNGKKLGFTIVHPNKKIEFYTPKIIFLDDNNYYIEKGKLSLNDSILDSANNNSIILNTTVCKLDGVYSLNKGYAIFRPVQILERNQSYIIVKKLDSFSIALYDHIALDGKAIKENQLIV